MERNVIVEDKHDVDIAIVNVKDKVSTFCLSLLEKEIIVTHTLQGYSEFIDIKWYFLIHTRKHTLKVFATSDPIRTLSKKCNVLCWHPNLELKKYSLN